VLILAEGEELGSNLLRVAQSGLGGPGGSGSLGVVGRRLQEPQGPVLRRTKVEGATIHSRFRDWAGNVSSFPREITETVLANVIGDKQAYRRSDALEKRRKLMEAWAAYCDRATPNVVHIEKRKTP
jgi:hypothetical protein